MRKSHKQLFRRLEESFVSGGKFIERDTGNYCKKTKPSKFQLQTETVHVLNVLFAFSVHLAYFL